MYHSIKRVSLLFLTLSLFIVISACGKTDKDNSSSNNQSSGNSSSSNGSSSGGGSNSEYDFGGLEIKILVGTVTEDDPFHENYTGTDKVLKQQLQREVEEKYNVKIKYLPYPDDAGWGSPRQAAIINGVTSGNPIGHIYKITTQWIANLASANAVVPVGRYIRDHADEQYDETLNQFGMFKGDTYAFGGGIAVHTNDGLYYNMDLVKELGLESPAKMWNEGRWTWETFAEYAATAQSALGEGRYAVGGIPAVYVQHMVPANGGYLINPITNKVAFNSTSAIKTINFLRDEISLPGYWEEAPEFDAGSASWKSGNVLLHPGEAWFMNSNMRWLDLGFDVSYVPYPMGPDISSIEDYKVGIPGQTMFAMSAGYEKSKDGAITDEELFMIWNDLQVWRPHQELIDALEITFVNRYDDEASVEAHLSIVQNIYNEQVFSIGISPFNEGGYYVTVNQAIKSGDAKSRMDSIAQAYQAKLNEIWN